MKKSQSRKTNLKKSSHLNNEASAVEESGYQVGGELYGPQELQLQPSATTVAHHLQPEDVVEARMTDGELIELLGHQYQATHSSYLSFHADKHNLAIIYDEIVSRFRDRNCAGDKRNGKPTLKQAFERAGWNYNAARKFRQRHGSDKNPVPVFVSSPKRLELTPGDSVKSDVGAIQGTVTHVHQSTDKIDIQQEGGGVANAVPIYDNDGHPRFSKVKVGIKKIKIGDRISCADNGLNYEYVGGGQFLLAASRCTTATLAGAKTTNSPKHDMASKPAAQKPVLESNRDLTLRGRKNKVAVTHARADTRTAAQPPAPKMDQPPVTGVGDRSTPTKHGFFHQMRLHETLPYLVRSSNSSDTLCECKSKTEAAMKVELYEREADSREKDHGLVVAGEGLPGDSATSSQEESRLAKLISRAQSSVKRRNARKANLPKSEHFIVVDKAFGQYEICSKLSNGSMGEIVETVYGNRHEVAKALEWQEQRWIARDEKLHQDTLDELEMLRDWLSRGADADGPMDNDRRHAVTSSIAMHEARIEKHERVEEVRTAMVVPTLLTT